MSTSCSSRWVAKLWRSVWGETRFLMPAASAASWTARLSWTRRQRLQAVHPGEQPALGQHHAATPALPPPLPEQFQQLRRQHRVPVLSALALFDADQQCACLSMSPVLSPTTSDTRRAGPVGDPERSPVLRAPVPLRAVVRPPRRSSTGRELLGRSAPARGAATGPGRSNVTGEQEAQRRHRAVDRWRLHAAIGLLDLETADVLPPSRSRESDRGRPRSSGRT